MGRNTAVPGSVLKVDPIKDPKDIRTIKRILEPIPRDFALFVVGINTNLRAVDLCRITKGMVSTLEIGEAITRFREQKTQKHRVVTWNRPCFQAIQRLLNEGKYIKDEPDDSQLFRGRHGEIDTRTIIYLVKKWTRSLNLDGHYGSHTLRKTFGYQHRTQHGTPVERLMLMFNHSTPKQTLDYLCIQPEEIRADFLKEI